MPTHRRQCHVQQAGMNNEVTVQCFPTHAQPAHPQAPIVVLVEKKLRKGKARKTRVLPILSEEHKLDRVQHVQHVFELQ
jgi:hypothetical protein